MGSQTADLFKIQKSDGTDKLTVSADGGLKLNTLTQGHIMIVGTEGLITTNDNLTFTSDTLTVNGSIVETSDKRL